MLKKINTTENVQDTPYVTFIPKQLKISEHFSSLMLSFDPVATVMELISLSTLSLVSFYWSVRLPNSMTLFDVAKMMWCISLLRRIYNNYLEAVFCTYPQYRTQSVNDHKLKQMKDLVGRDKEQLDQIVVQDRLTFLSQFCLDLFVYFCIPGFYPENLQISVSLSHRMLALLLNHYVMSFGMYWSHRALHKNPWLWRNIHIVHHWAKHPLSRTTYQDHWLDNFFNAIVGHIFAQILVPLDYHIFWLSRILRVCESLEKHSGVSCYFNLIHSVQRFLPYAQMPHHHDWHHEGHKGCNYTFTSIGGIWDCIFGTRKNGRHPAKCETKFDIYQSEKCNDAYLEKSFFDGPWACFIPLIMLAFTVIFKLCYPSLIL